MRTTLDLDEDVILVAKQIAQQRGTTVGRVVSELVRNALQPKSVPKTRNGVPLFMPEKGAKKPHLELVNQAAGRRMSVALLVVNVLVALFDPNHPNHDHEDAHSWFGAKRKRGWATGV